MEEMQKQVTDAKGRVWTFAIGKLDDMFFWRCDETVLADGSVLMWEDDPREREEHGTGDRAATKESIHATASATMPRASPVLGWRARSETNAATSTTASASAIAGRIASTNAWVKTACAI